MVIELADNERIRKKSNEKLQILCMSKRLSFSFSFLTYCNDSFLYHNDETSYQSNVRKILRSSNFPLNQIKVIQQSKCRKNEPLWIIIQLTTQMEKKILKQFPMMNTVSIWTLSIKTLWFTDVLLSDDNILI